MVTIPAVFGVAMVIMLLCWTTGPRWAGWAAGGAAVLPGTLCWWAAASLVVTRGRSAAGARACGFVLVAVSFMLLPFLGIYIPAGLVLILAGTVEKGFQEALVQRERAARTARQQWNVRRSFA